LSKLLKVCDIFSASRFNIPKREDINSQINSLQIEIYEKQNFLKQAETSIKDFIRDKIGIEDIPARYERYRIYFQKERVIYYNLNKCIVRGNFIDGEIWVPSEKFEEVQEGLNRVTGVNQSKLTASLSDPESTDVSPPTFIKTNDLTGPFQHIVNEYGVPRYQEINPALFAIVTFPFLFGVMFGDIGHGLMLFLAGLFLVVKNDELSKNEVIKPFLKARYLLLFMGFFAFYCGWMYNDFLSLPLGIFGSCYKETQNAIGETVIQRASKDCVYPVGLDPKWYVAKNELSFINSLKMKTSVIFGISQMILGIILKGMNAAYFGNTVDFVFEFIPQLIFMTALFGYLIIMIFIKWSTDWTGRLSQAPSLISQLLMIFLNFGSVGREVRKKFKIIIIYRKKIKNHFGESTTTTDKKTFNFGSL
jgi:V-type H+-transporting ATPase subunit a